jgi:predicted TIM-barrel fold metal-dependent hydrolase
MDREGVDVSFLYPSFGLFVLASDDIEPRLAVAIARGYNNWLADFCSEDPERLRGVAMLPLQDPEGAAAEAERCAVELGIRGAFVRPNPVGGRRFDDPAYDRLWEVMSHHSMALGIHEGGFPRLPQVVQGRLVHPQQVHICTHPMEQMISAVSFIYGGVLERNPGLRVAFLEAGCGWVPFWLHRMDEHWQASSTRDFGLHPLSRPPSEYFQRQCYVSADSNEYMLAQVIELIGDERIVFTTDYPHPDSPWPHAAEEFLAIPGVSDESKAKILWDNALALYGTQEVVAG